MLHQTDANAMNAAGPHTAAASGQPAARGSRRLAFSLSITIIAFCVFLLSLLWGVVVLKSRAEKQAEIATAMTQTANIARAVLEHAVRTIREADQVLKFVQHQYNEHGSKMDLRSLVDDGPIVSRLFTYISIIEPNGTLLATSRPSFQRVNLADREHFRVHVERDSLNQPFISKPFVGQSTGTWSFQLSRRINKPDLGFGGVAVGAIDPSYFSDFYGELNLGRQGLVMLVGHDGIVRARRSGDDTAVGQDIGKSALFTHLRNGPTGTYTTQRTPDDPARLFSYRSLPGYPLVVAVGIGEEGVLAAFHQRERDYQLAALLTSAFILLATAVLLALTSRQRRMALDLRRRNIELTRAELAARAGERRSLQLAAIVATSRDAIISRGTDGTILTWNPAAEDLFGWSAQEAVGSKISIFIPPGHEDEVRRNMERLHRGLPVAAYDTVRRRKDGRLFDVSLMQSPIKDEKGEVVAVSLIFRDISQRKRDEAERAQLAAIVENSNDAIISRSLDGRFVSWNKGAERMFGYTAAEAIGQPTTLILPPEDLKDVARKLEFTRRGRSPAPYETRRVTKDGRIIDVVASVSPIRGADGEISTISIIFHDITERKRAQQRISFLSQYDTLTGLPNRDLFRDRVGLAMVRARRQGETVGVMLFNLDRFKRVNEGLGLDAGDELLRQVAARLKDNLRDVDTVARLGADEFAILVEGMRVSADISTVAEKLTEAFAAPFEVIGHEVVAVPSIGFTLYPNDTGDSQKLLEHAEIAMDRIKREGGGGYRLYDTEPATIRGGHLGLEMRLRHALERGELDLHYQPKVRLLDGAVTGAEALLRWNSPDLGPVSPAKFIPVAEESGLIVLIGEWVLRTACAQMRAWHELGHAIGIAVNLSPRQFRQKDLAGVVADALKQSGFTPDHLELEITEGTAMANAEQTVKVLGNLHGLGVRLSVDDFGTGYSSLSYLKRFPLDNLKIDRSFVLDVGNDPNGEAIVHATIALARSLKLKTIAEGVETRAQRDFLARAGCDEMQGYLFSRPLPAAEFHMLIERPRASAVARS